MLKMENSIGKRVKTLRINRRMTLAELGEKAKLSPSYLSQIERDRMNPSLTTLMNIARSLNVEPRYFFESGDNSTLVLQGNRGHQPEILSPAMVYFPLSPEDPGNKLHVHRVVIQPRSQPQEFDPYSGEEMCFVLTGQLTIVVGDEKHVLKAGDSIHYDALLLHNWSNQGDQPCELIWSRAGYQDTEQ
jgi:transcriptional regulator with XRE-family HTH domain